MIRWREAGRAEVPAVVALVAADRIGHAGPPADLPACLAAFDAVAADPNVTLVVGERDGTIVATYQITILHHLSLTAPTRALLEAVRVRADLRGQGIGAALLADAEARAAAAGATLIQFTSNAGRRDAHRFYEAHGFAASHLGFKKVLGR